MNAYESFEEEAKKFFQDTGYMLLGKDDCRGIHTDEERAEAYKKWKAKETL